MGAAVECHSGGVTLSIRVAVAECHLGHVAVAATDVGLCLIAFGSSADELRAEVAGRFPNAEVADGDAEFAASVARVASFVESPGTGLDLPLDVRGTAFQLSVWEALRAIPPGSTATYGQIAARIGRPTAVRAVAGACAANPVAVAVPCHRVVGGGGKLTGYRWGVERKRALLEREAGTGARSPQ